MADQTQTLKGLSESVAEHVASKLKLTPSSSLDSLILKELKNISSLLGSSISKNQSVSAGQYRIPSLTATENYDSVSETPRQKKTLLERFQANNRQMLTGAVSKLIPESIKSRLNPTVKAEDDSPSIDSSKKQSGIVEKLLAKIASPASDKTKDSQTTPATAAPKSLLETRTEVQKVEVQNFKELSEIIPTAFKDYFKEINTNLKDIAKLLGNIEKKDFGGDGGGDGLLGNLLKGKGMLRMLKNTGVGRMARKGNVLLKRTAPRAIKSLGGKGLQLARTAATGLGTLATTPIASMGAGAAIATTAAGVAGGEIIGGMAGRAIGSNETVSEALYGSKTAGKEAYEKYGTGMMGFTRAGYDYAFGAGKEARQGIKEGEVKNAELQKEIDEKTTALEKYYKKKGYNTLKEFGADVKAGKTEPVKWNKETKKLDILPLRKSATSSSPKIISEPVKQEAIKPIREAIPPLVKTPPITPSPVKQAVDKPSSEPLTQTAKDKTPKENTLKNYKFEGKSREEIIAKLNEQGIYDSSDITDPELKKKIWSAVTPNTGKMSEGKAKQYQQQKLKQAFTAYGKSKPEELKVGLTGQAAEDVKSGKSSTTVTTESTTNGKGIRSEKVKSSEEIKPIREAIPPLIKARNDSAQIAPAPETTPSAKPTEEAAPKGDKHLETIASNTNKTNDTLAGLTSGFAALAKALEKLGVSVASNPPTTINNIAGGKQQASQGPSPVALANAGNQDITNFRRSIVEASRFQPA